MQSYSSIPADRKRNIASWTPVVLSIALGFSEFPDDAFRTHIPYFYVCFTSLLGKPISIQLQYCLKIIFERVNQVYMISSQAPMWRKEENQLKSTEDLDSAHIENDPNKKNQDGPPTLSEFVPIDNSPLENSHPKELEARQVVDPSNELDQDTSPDDLDSNPVDHSRNESPNSEYLYSNQVDDSLTEKNLDEAKEAFESVQIDDSPNEGNLDAPSEDIDPAPIEDDEEADSLPDANI